MSPSFFSVTLCWPSLYLTVQAGCHVSRYYMGAHTVPQKSHHSRGLFQTLETTRSGAPLPTSTRCQSRCCFLFQAEFRVILPRSQLTTEVVC